ncbi:MAG: hypothetical protein Tsb0026_01210 [Sulfuricaulis sp.]
MRSSTSSSNDRLPRGDWVKPLLVALLFTAVLVAGWELTVRKMGYEPSVIDSKELWADARQRASRLGKYAVVLVGASRMQLNINLEVLKKYTGTTPVQLAIIRNHFWPVLEDLAQDESITGTVLVDVTIPDINPNRNLMAPHASLWIDYYHQSALAHAQPYYMPLETQLRDGINNTFALRTAGVRPKDMLIKWLNDKTVDDNYIRISPDRSAAADFTKIDAKKRYDVLVSATKELGPVAFTMIPDFTRHLAALEKLVQKIQGRGGRVVLIQFPVSREIREIVNARYPRDRYWDRIAKETSAQTIHYEDYPALSKYDLPDGYHLDYRQAIPFTKALGEILFPPRR